ncbi:MAG: hypothetical protein MK554_08060, partial [Planctomycetes bacterium]|nr:hypothetical protein [Planctomycetota bacterium]
MPRHTAAAIPLLALLCAISVTPRVSAKITYVKITPAQDLAAVIKVAHANTVFVLAPGTYKL